MEIDCVIEKRPMWDYCCVVEVTILRPVRDVWPHFIGARKNLWTKSEYTTIAGKPGELGEIYTHAHTFNGVRAFYEAVKVKPGKQLVLKITHKKAEGDEGRVAGYDLITFHEMNCRTLLVFQQVLALPSVMLEENLELVTEKQDRRVCELFQNLKSVVESAQ